MLQMQWHENKTDHRAYYFREDDAVTKDCKDVATRKTDGKGMLELSRCQLWLYSV